MYKKARHMNNNNKRVFLNNDNLVIDDVRHNVDTIDTLPAELHPRRFSERRNKTHLLVGGIHSEFQPLTSWYPCKVQFKGHTFDSSEQAYQCEKRTFVRMMQQLQSCCTLTHHPTPKTLNPALMD